jgi:hypothetical protein
MLCGKQQSAAALVEQSAAALTQQAASAAEAF